MLLGSGGVSWGFRLASSPVQAYFPFVPGKMLVWGYPQSLPEASG